MADQIIVLDGGVVAETGDQAALLARPGIYAELFTLQAEGYLGR
jgi:ATP-binding cassette subfamily B protein